jgi:hypothetical protein
MLGGGSFYAALNLPRMGRVNGPRSAAGRVALQLRRIATMRLATREQVASDSHAGCCKRSLGCVPGVRKFYHLATRVRSRWPTISATSV